MRPIPSTPVASIQNIEAPDSARLPICTKCQSLASPLTAEYWHIGATMMRLGSVRPRRVIGENRLLMDGISGWEGEKAPSSIPLSFGEVEFRTHEKIRAAKPSLHQRELQQQIALDHGKIIVRNQGQHGVAFGRDMGVDALHVVDLVAEIG